MDPILKALLGSWEWRPVVLLVLLGLGSLYSRGWWHLRRRGHSHLASGWRLAAYWGGIGVMGLALLSPIDTLQSFLFAVHMIQHELLMMVAPPLLLLANPFPFFLWSLPSRLRRAIGGLLVRKALFRRGLRFLTTPWGVWALYVLTLWLWHLPTAYDAALRHQWLHDLEHLSFAGTAILFWWQVIGAAPQIHGLLGYGFRLVYLLAALAQNEILAVGISLSQSPLYPYYQGVPRLWGLSVLDDQRLGGAIMWIPGGMMYVLAVVILVAAWLNHEEKQMRQAARARLRPQPPAISPPQ
ncbi:MAG: cytochrome c oxidase assembly protein [Nitrospinota bacterium]|nr:MAG: cytochrome c oxidase assembly protein [Nitrospinota bacterium]